MDFSNKKVAIIGLGIEGKDALKFLAQQGAEVTVFDQKEKEELSLGDVRGLSLEFRCGPDYLKSGLSGFDYIIRSPGVRPDLPEIIEAVKSGAWLTSAINIFFEFCPCQIIGVTGTKGKGTTATLIYESLKASGKLVYLAGNIGKPYLELLPRLTRSDLVVLELSSFQLIDINKSPHIAVVLNITTDHLDWHRNRKEYVEAKQNIVKFQTPNDFAVIARDYETSLNFTSKTQGEVYFFSKKEKVKGAYVLGGTIILNVAKVKKPRRGPFGIGGIEKLLLRGKHNWENVAAATCASYLAGATIEGIKQAVFSFEGLPHRLELVATYQGITFYNDSFATSPTPVLAAVDAFSEPLIIILGGSSKDLAYSQFGKELAKRKNLKAVLIIGEVGGEIRQALKEADFSGRVVEGGKNMAEIVKNAVLLAKPGDIVLLSPAAASFDMFHDYKDRGNKFKKEVLSLASN